MKLLFSIFALVLLLNSVVGVIPAAIAGEIALVALSASLPTLMNQANKAMDNISEYYYQNEAVTCYWNDHERRD